MDIVNTYVELGSYRAAGDLCGIDHKTVKRVVQRWRTGSIAEPRITPTRARNTDCVEDLIWERVKKTRGRITAKRLLPQARAVGYEGSARNFRRAVMRVKTRWARSEHRRRPWMPSPGEHLVIDWGEENRLKIFCAVLAWSRYRFVRFAADMKRETTLRLLAECIEDLGAVPHVVLSDRMGCLRAQTVANVVVPHPDYVRFATHFGFRPDSARPLTPSPKGSSKRSSATPSPISSCRPRTGMTATMRTSTHQRGAKKSTRGCTRRSVQSRPNGWSRNAG